jgi:hypothetical protein
VELVRPSAGRLRILGHELHGERSGPGLPRGRWLVDEEGGDLTAKPYSCGVDRTATAARIARRAWGADLAVATATLLWTMLVIGIDHGNGNGYSLPVAFFYGALGVIPLMLRRRAPWLCLLLVAVPRWRSP